MKIRGRLRELGKSLLNRFGLGLLISVMVGVVITPLVGLTKGAVVGLGSGLATMVTTALADWLTVPVDELTSPSPTSVLHNDRSVARVRGLVQGLGLALIVGLVTGACFGPTTGLTVGAVAGVASVLAGGFDSAWGLFLVARAWLAFSRRLPWDITGFLEDAHRRGVLRQAGATHQFRHARLQDRMARLDE